MTSVMYMIENRNIYIVEQLEKSEGGNAEMVNTNGLTQTDMRIFSELMTKANNLQLAAMQHQIVNELGRRNRK